MIAPSSADDSSASSAEFGQYWFALLSILNGWVTQVNQGLAPGVMLRPDSIHLGASVTKPVVCTRLMQLVLAGLVSGQSMLGAATVSVVLSGAQTALRR
jgi:hypothetical protein